MLGRVFIEDFNRAGLDSHCSQSTQVGEFFVTTSAYSAEHT